MNSYELIVLLHPDLEIDVDTPVRKIEKLIDSAGGKVLKRDNWGKRRLAYKIKRQEFAVYIYFVVQLKPNRVRELEAALLITEEVMRHLVVRQLEAKGGLKKSKSPQAELKAESKQAVTLNEDK